ncbi:MAG: Gfo/Idh/MocA family protein [Myxococcota bacterium]
MRVVIAGYGYIAHHHARAVCGAEDTVLHGVLGRDASKCAAFATQYEAPKRYTSVDEVAQDADVDAVIIAWPNALHAPVAEAMMRAGKHVLVEKPMAMNEAEARSMTAAAQETGRHLMVGHMWRFDREAQALREVVANGSLGDIVKTKGYGVHTHWGPTGWFTQPELAGGGALIDMGVHAIDTVRYLLGDPEPLRVYARLGTRFGAYDVDDNGLLVIEWSGGTTSLIESGWWHPHSDGVEASTQLFGTRGYGRLFPTSWSHGTKDALVSEAPGFPTREEHCDQHIYDGQVVAFAQQIKEGMPAIPGPEHGRIVMAICDAAYRSSELGQAVTP